MSIEICDCGDALCICCDDNAIPCALEGQWHCGTCLADCRECAQAERDQYLADIAEDRRLNGDRQ
jgi:hypothetical protein